MSIFEIIGHGPTPLGYIRQKRCRISPTLRAAVELELQSGMQSKVIALNRRISAATVSKIASAAGIHFRTTKLHDKSSGQKRF